MGNRKFAQCLIYFSLLAHKTFALNVKRFGPKCKLLGNKKKKMKILL